MKDSAKLFLGIWQLVSWVIQTKEGEKTYPLGEDAKGYLIYLESGFMSVHLTRCDRPEFLSKSVFDVTKDEALQSYSSYASYCGRYKIQKDKVLHFIQMHTCPNWQGSIQERYYQFEGSFLRLTHDLEGNSSHLIWEKVAS